MEKVSDLFKEKLDHIASMLKDISDGYVDSRFQEKTMRESYFACSMLQALVDHKSVFDFLSKIHRKDLSDSLVTHNIKYLKILEKHENEIEDEDINSQISEEEGAKQEGAKNAQGLQGDQLDKSKLSQSEIFKQNLEILKKELKSRSKIESDLSAKDFDTICAFLSRVLDRVKDIFSEQNHNEKEIDKLIASGISAFFSQLPISEQDSIAEDMNNVRELWNFEKDKEYLPEDKQVIFLKNFREELDFSECKKSEDVFKLLVSHLVLEKEILQSCSEAALLSLYTRIRNSSRVLNIYPKLLFELHKESKIRYLCNRVSPEGYDLLDRFQKFDTSISNFESMENNSIEKYLITKDLFGGLVDNIANNADDITFLKLTNDRSLISVLDKLDSHLKSTSNQESIERFRNMRDRFSQSIDADVQKKFNDLDKFQTYALKQKYIEFFSNFVDVIHEKNDYLDYLKYILDRKLASNYYVNNASNSIDKLRKMYADRDEVQKLFSKVDLLGIFLKASSNKITSLDFRDKIKQVENQTTRQFVAVLVQNIVQECTAFQLDVAYNIVMKDDLNAVEKFLKKEIIKQVHFRSSISKMLLSIFSGKRQEYKKLKELSKKASGSK